ncbi:MAG TPA: glycosyltransferase family 2 protein [Thermoplasmata archaeon]|nr:glycosyltransferase family 2 protein [Thermoplasmata archaeon]
MARALAGQAGPPAAPGPPYVSVVVVAHARSTFLGDALASLERQTLSRGRFEVILVKDLEDAAWRPQIERLGATVRDVAPGPLGSWISELRPALRGELVAFLDDDDAYLPEKLEFACDAFAANKVGVYYHHGVRPWDPPSGAGARGAPGRTPLSPPLRAVGPEEIRRQFRFWWRRGAAFNLSSIVVRRELLGVFPEALARIEVSLSAFLFYSAVAVGGTVLLEDRPLTRYRRAEGFSPRGPKPRSVRRIASLARPRGADAEVLREMVRPLRDPALEGPLRAAIALAGIVRSLESGEGRRRLVAAALLDWTRGRSLPGILAERAAALAALRFLVSPQWGRRYWDHARTRGPDGGGSPSGP